MSNEMFAKTRMGSLHVGNEETLAKITKLVGADQQLGWQMRALIIVATEIAAGTSEQRSLDETADALLDAGAICAFHAARSAEDTATFTREAWDIAADAVAQENASGGVH